VSATTWKVNDESRLASARTTHSTGCAQGAGQFKLEKNLLYGKFPQPIKRAECHGAGGLLLIQATRSSGRDVSRRRGSIYARRAITLLRGIRRQYTTGKPTEFLTANTKQEGEARAAPGEDAEAVVLDFIIHQPGPAGGSLAGLGRHGAIVGPLLYCRQPPDGAEAARSRRTCGRSVLTVEAFRVRGPLSGRAIAETVLRWPLHQS
jgi:hypothetical protein